MIRIYVPDLAEFMPLVNGARRHPDCRVREPLHGYWRIEADRALHFHRKELGLGPALWNSALTGGFRGRIMSYGWNEMHLVSEDVAA